MEVVVNHLSYDSFGNLISQTNTTVDSRYAFTGREYDRETNLHYYRARYYDAASGRFIGGDPIGLNGGDTNFFAYVQNSPVLYSDPSGKCLPCVVSVAVAVGFIMKMHTGQEVKSEDAAADAAGVFVPGLPGAGAVASPPGGVPDALKGIEVLKDRAKGRHPADAIDVNE